LHRRYDKKVIGGETIMYLTHYNLRKKPFSISPDPSFLWLGNTHKEALAVLKYGILENKGFLVLTGDVGTGKTALINALVKIIDVTAYVAAIPDPGLSSLDFFNFLSEEFGMKRHFESKGDFLIYFKKFLYGAYEKNKKVLLIIDEAQRLNHELLEQIRLLSNIEKENQKLINIFFVGQSEFNNMLSDEKSKAVRQRIAVSYHLDRLTENETARYIRHRLKISGARTEIFTNWAVREIYSFSNGIPRLINIICDNALLTGYSAEVTSIDKEIVAECAGELQITGEIPNRIDDVPQYDSGVTNPDISRRSQLQQIGVSLIVLLFLAVGGYFMYHFQTDDSPRWEMGDIAAKKDLSIPEKEKKTLVTEMSDQNRVQEIQPLAEINSLAATIEINDERIENNMNVAKAQENSDHGINDLKRFVSHFTNLIQDSAQNVVVYFEHNSNEIPDQAFESLDRISRFASRNPDSEITIEGFTDSFGNYGYNKTLSKYRADIVKNYFAGQGISLARIKTFGRGPENPIAANDTFEGRKQNRRVEIKIDMKE
jgi:general secretion pathway protein A